LIHSKVWLAPELGAGNILKHVQPQHKYLAVDLAAPASTEKALRQLASENRRLHAEVDHLKNLLAAGGTTILGELISAEKSFHQSDQDLHTIINNIPTMVGYWDRELRNRFGNLAYADWAGIEPDRLPGMHVRDVIGEETYRLNLPYLEAALRGEVQQFERRLPATQRHQPRDVLIQYLPDIDGREVRGLYTMVTDISSTKLAESALRERDQKLRGLYELSPLGIAMTDLAGRFVEFNEAFRNICGYSTQELMELNERSLSPPRFAALEAAQRELLKQGGRFGPFEKEYLRKDGCLVPVALNGVLITGSDGQEYLWSIVEDLSKRKQTEQLQVVLNEYHELSLDVLERSREKMVTALTHLSRYRDNETGQHIERSELYVKALANALAAAGHYPDQLTKHYIDLIVKATPMHDLGKVGVPDHVLLKPGRHTPEETLIMQTHAAIGESILLVAAGGEAVVDSLLMVASRMAGAHHENWDGSGYPRRLKGSEIPLEARLMAVADVYDALTTPRVYKQAWAHEVARLEILSLKGIKFDPLIVEAFEQVHLAFREIAGAFGDQDPQASAT
jgi:PAS domain S-box-containing protein